MSVQFGWVFENDNKLSAAQVILEKLTELLCSMYAMAVTQECGIGPAMLMIIVRVPSSAIIHLETFTQLLEQKVLTSRFCGGGIPDTSPAELAKRLAHSAPFLALIIRQACH